MKTSMNRAHNELVLSLIKIKEQESAIKKEKERIKKILVEKYGADIEIEFGECILSIKEQTAEYLDKRRMATEQPKIYKEYAYTTTFVKLNTKKKGK